MKYLRSLACCALAAATFTLVGGSQLSPAATSPPTATSAKVSVVPDTINESKRTTGVVRKENTIDVSDVGGAAFATPSGSIVCDLKPRSALYPEAWVRCDILSRTYTPPPRSADCDLDWGSSLYVADKAGFSCSGDTIAGEALITSSRVKSWWNRKVDGTAAAPLGVSAALPYGKTMIAGDLRCTSRRAGLTCQNTRTRAKFFLSRARYRLSN